MEQTFSDLIILLANGISQRRMYFDAHPRVVATAVEVSAGLNDVMARSPDGEFSFGVFNGKFVRDGHYLVGPSIAGRTLIGFAEHLGCGGFVFRRTMDPDTVVALFRLGAERSDKPVNLAQAQALLAAHGLRDIVLTPPMEEEGRSGAAVPAEASTRGDGELAAEFAPLLNVYQSMYDSVSINNVAVHGGGGIDRDQARSAGRELVSLADEGVLDVMQFMRYPDYDSYTIGHSVRVAALSAMLGRVLGWSPELLAEVAAAGLLHDLGKSCIPEEVLFKAGRLDADERLLIESHPTLGAQILLDNGERSPVVVSAAWGHHLGHDGSGYPSMPTSCRPGAVAEVVHVCDVFEALTASRPYKKALSPRASYEIMLKGAAVYHPRILGTFIASMGLYPPGSEVRLNDRSIAVVVASGAVLDRPRVRVTSDPEGQPIPGDRQPAIDLHQAPDLRVMEILSTGAGMPLRP